MSFLIIDRERYALQLGETILGGDADEMLALSPLGALPPFAVITSGVEPVAVIRALPGSMTVRLGDHVLGETPHPMAHGDRLVVGTMTLLYGDVGAAGRTSPIHGLEESDLDLLANWAQTEGTASTGGRLIALSTGVAYPVPDHGLVLGRDPECSLVVNSRAVSRRHATITPGLLGYTVSDESSNGTLVNGRRVEGSVLLRQGDRIRVGDAEFRFEADAAEYEPQRGKEAAEPAIIAPPETLAEAPHRGTLLATLEVTTRGADEGQRYRIERAAVQMGRAAHNDIRIGDESVSGTHATLLQRGGSWHLLDLGSRNGCYVDGERITERQLTSGCEVRLGNVKLVFRAIAGAADEQATRGIVGLTDEMLRSRR